MSLFSNGSNPLIAQIQQQGTQLQGQGSPYSMQQIQSPNMIGHAYSIGTGVAGWSTVPSNPLSQDIKDRKKNLEAQADRINTDALKIQKQIDDLDELVANTNPVVFKLIDFFKEVYNNPAKPYNEVVSELNQIISKELFNKKLDGIVDDN